MRFAFMSFSCPDEDLDGLIGTAQKYGYDGVEPRVGSGHKHGIELGAEPGLLKEARRRNETGGVKICCIATSCKYADPAESGENIDLTRKYIELAGLVGAPRLRVFGGLLPEGMSRGQAVSQLAECLKKVSDKAEETGVNVCVETHDDWCNPEHLAEVMRRVGHPRIRINWDIMHPARKEGLSMDEAFGILKDWVDHVHFHDGLALEDVQPGKPSFLPVGEGVVDHRRAVELLASASYGGYLSGEWINWEPCEIHLPRELKTMKSYMKS